MQNVSRWFISTDVGKTKQTFWSCDVLCRGIRGDALYKLMIDIDIKHNKHFGHVMCYVADVASGYINL